LWDFGIQQFRAGNRGKAASELRRSESNVNITKIIGDPIVLQRQAAA
jgi:hypothetical protein